MFNKKLIIDSLKNLSKPSRMTNKNTFDLKESGSKREGFVSAQEGVETPIYKAVKTGASPIEGKGLFAEQSIRKGDVIGVSHIRKKFMKNGEEYKAPFPSTVLGYYNHSEEPNVYEVDKGDYILMVAGRDIQRGHEITSDYTKHNIGDLEVPDDFKKGGSIKRPSLPNRKSPRSYSRSFEATNKLFAKNPLFAKSKSRKNKIFDPRAQYFDNGGITTQEEIDAANTAMMKARLAYANEFGNPAAKRMINLPDEPYQFDNRDTGTHYMASMDNYAVPQIQDENGVLQLRDYGPESNEAIRFDSDEDANYFAEHYKDVSPGFINEKKEGGASEQKIIFSSKGGDCLKDEYWNGTKCVKIPKNTRIVYHTDKDVYDKAFAAESDSSHFYNNAKSDFNKVRALQSRIGTSVGDAAKDKARDAWFKERDRQEKKWHTDNSEPGTTINYKYKGPKSNLKIKPVGLERNDDGYAFPRFKKPVVHNVYEEPIKEEEIDSTLPPLKPELLPQQNYELQGTYEEDQVPEYSPSYPENRIGYNKYNWYSGKQVGMGTKWTLPKRQPKTGGFYPKYSKKVEDIQKYMEGYEDEDGNHIPGEIEKAEQEGRQINFKGNVSKTDKEAQENYNKEYDEYENLKNYQNQIMNLMQYKLNKKQFGGPLNKFLGGGGNPTCPKDYKWNPETNRCEKKSGCPENFHFDPKSGRCISNYQKETVKVMSAAYKYDKYGNKLSFPTDYDDSEFSPVSDDQLEYDKSSWPKDYSIQGIVNPIYFEDHGSILVSAPDYVPKYPGDSQGYIETYPDLNYKVVVDSTKPEGYNKDESIYYVKSENTHQFKKYKEWEKLKKLEKDNIDNAKKLGLVMTEDDSPTSVRIQKYPQEHYKTLKQLYDDEGNDVSSYWDNESYDFKPGMKDVYENDRKTLQELYNDPEYLGHEVYNKSFDETFKDRGTKNIERYKAMCPHCRYYHGQRMTIDPDYIYDSSNPYQNPVDEGRFTKPFYELEYDYADPTIESMYPKLEFEEGVDRPDYYPSDYDMIMPTIGIGPGETKSKLNRGRLMNGKGQNYKHTTYRQTKDLDFGTREATRLIPRMVQKATGYDRNFMEGYEDKEGNYFPGEIEKAEEEGRQINFKGASSLRDRKQQKIYNEKWKNSEEENKLIRQQNEDLLKEYGLNREEYVKLYGDFKNGGISLQLTKDEIQKYVDGGYVVEDLPKARFGKISKTVKPFFRSNYNPLSIPIKKIGERIARQHSSPSRSRGEIATALFKPHKYTAEYFGQAGTLPVEYGIGKRDLVANYFSGNETGFEPIDYDIKSDSGLFAAIEEYGPLKVFAMNSKIQHGESLDFFNDIVRRNGDINMFIRGTDGRYIGDQSMMRYRKPGTRSFFIDDMHIQSPLLGIDRPLSQLYSLELERILKLDPQALSEFSYKTKQSLNQLFEQYGKDSIPFEIDPPLRTYIDPPLERKPNFTKSYNPQFTFELSPVGPRDNVGGHMAFLQRTPEKEFQLTTRDLWGFRPEAYDKKWGMYNSFLRAQTQLMDAFGKPFVLTQTNPIKLKQGGESNYELGDTVDKATMERLRELGYTFETI